MLFHGSTSEAIFSSPQKHLHNLLNPGILQTVTKSNQVYRMSAHKNNDHFVLNEIRSSSNGNRYIIHFCLLKDDCKILRPSLIYFHFCKNIFCIKIQSRMKNITRSHEKNNSSSTEDKCLNFREI